MPGNKRKAIKYWGTLGHRFHFLKEGITVRLEVGHIFIKDIQFGAESKIEDGVLYVSEEAVKEVVLEDEHIKSVKFDNSEIAREESVRITPVKDVIEPRVK